MTVDDLIEAERVLGNELVTCINTVLADLTGGIAVDHRSASEAMARRITNCKAHLLFIPSNTPPLIVNCDKETITEKLLARVELALEELSPITHEELIDDEYLKLHREAVEKAV